MNICDGTCGGGALVGAQLSAAQSLREAQAAASARHTEIRCVLVHGCVLHKVSGVPALRTTSSARSGPMPGRMSATIAAVIEATTVPTLVPVSTSGPPGAH